MKVLVSKKTHNYYYIKELNQDYHCKEGIITKEDLNSDKTLIKSHKGREFAMFNGNHYDYLQKMKRVAQVIIPKDFGYIASRTGMSSKTKLIEAGTGSGFSGIFFSGIVEKLYTYERHPNHFEQAQKNLEKYGFDNFEILNKELVEVLENKGVPEKCNMMFLDMPEPIQVLESLQEGTLENGSFIVCYLPSIIQVDELMKFCATGEKYFVCEVSETQIREWKVSERSVRPQHHKDCDFTAFLVFIRYLGN